MAELEDQRSDEKENLRRAEADLRKAMPRTTNQGLQALKEIVKRDNIKGYLGTVVDNFTLVDGSKFQTAVEVAAGNSLFHVIVDNDNTAAYLIDRLSKENRGRLTFMPLSQLNVRVS